MSNLQADSEYFRLAPFLNDLRTRLAALPTLHQAAFITYCCERLLPFLDAFERARSADGGAAVVHVQVQRLWSGLVRPLTASDFDEASGVVDSFDLGEEGCCEEQDGAIDTVEAVVLSLDWWRNPSAGTAARVGGLVINRVHQHLTDKFVGRTYSLSPEQTRDLLNRIDTDPAMRRVERDLNGVVAFLKQQASIDEEVVAQLRALAASPIVAV
jgi:hypothetical protein